MPRIQLPTTSNFAADIATVLPSRMEGDAKSASGTWLDRNANEPRSVTPQGGSQ